MRSPVNLISACSRQARFRLTRLSSCRAPRPMRCSRVFSDLADIVVVDSAPVLPVTDAAVLSTHADAILLVVSAGVDKRRDVVRAVEMLTQINAPIVGTVLNRSPEADSYSYARYGYGYGEKSSEKPAKADKKAAETSIDLALSATTSGQRQRQRQRHAATGTAMETAP